MILADVHGGIGLFGILLIIFIVWLLFFRGRRL
jgi:hypothetical protein